MHRCLRSSLANWWERSPYSGYTYYFCIVITGGGAGNGGANYSFGVAPALRM